VSTYDRRTRDRYRQVVSGVTGVAGLGALTLTGGLMGLAAGKAANEQEPQDAVQPAETSADQPVAQQAGRKPRMRERQHVTRVTTRYVTGGTVSSEPGPGGTVSSGGSSSSSGSSDPAPQPGPEPAPAPEPDPPPAPSSGS
jgi:uncharacterized protein (DUF3084 family)